MSQACYFFSLTLVMSHCARNFSVLMLTYFAAILCAMQCFHSACLNASHCRQLHSSQLLRQSCTTITPPHTFRKRTG
jgi:hypothetical protein